MVESAKTSIHQGNFNEQCDRTEFIDSMSGDFLPDHHSRLTTIPNIFQPLFSLI
jgi:hypothetical protein